MIIRESARGDRIKHQSEPAQRRHQVSQRQERPQPPFLPAPSVPAGVQRHHDHTGDFVGVKSYKAKGKRLTTYAVECIEELEPTRMPEPEDTEDAELVESEEEVSDNE